MGYHTKCTHCYGTGRVYRSLMGSSTRKVPCRKCEGTGNVKPYRRALTMAEACKIGWEGLVSSPQYRDDKCCVSCNKALSGRRRTFCSTDCRRGYWGRVWGSAHWQKRAIAHRDGAACRGCGTVHESPIREGGKPYPEYQHLQLDHIKALHLGGTEAPENCQLLCERCHLSKTRRERSQGRAAS